MLLCRRAVLFCPTWLVAQVEMWANVGRSSSRAEIQT